MQKERDHAVWDMVRFKSEGTQLGAPLLCEFAALMLVVGVLPTLAQEAAYSDPQGRFTLALPDGWTDESTNQYGLFTNGDVSLYVVAVPADDVQNGITAALTTVGLDFNTPPMQTSEIQEISGTWTQNVYAAVDGPLAAVIAQIDGDTTYALIFYAPTMAAMQGAAAADMRPIVQSFTLAGQETSSAKSPT